MSQITYSRGEADEEALAFWTRIFGVPTSEFAGMHDSFPPGDRMLLAARSEGRLVGSVEIYRMGMTWIGEQTQTWGCVGNVSTDPEFRGKGIAKNLLLTAEEVFKEWECATGLLFTGIFDFYAPFGWRVVHGEFGAGTYAKRNSTAFQPVADIRAALPELKRLHKNYGVGGLFQADRTELAWGTRVLTRLLTKNVWSSEDAYVVLDEDEETARFAEIVGEPSAARELCLCVLESLAKDKIEARFDCQVPPGLEAYLEGFRYERGVSGMILPVKSERTEFEGLRLVGLDRF